MSSGEHRPPGHGPGPGWRPFEEAPIISLDEARRRREQRQRDAELDEAERAQVEADERQATQLRLLQDLLVEERLSGGDLSDMIKLGIVTTDEDLLPCACRSRSESYFEWEAKYYSLEREEPDEALITRLRLRLAEGPDAAAARQLSAELGKRMPEPNRVYCPLLSHTARGGSPPCVEALAGRGENRFDAATGQLLFVPAPLDPEDPVVSGDLRPCVVLGRELFRVIMTPVWAREPQGR